MTTLDKYFNTRVCLVFFMLLACIGRSVFGAQNPLELLPEGSVTLSRQIIQAIYAEKFTEGEDLARKLVRKYPDHPIGYFFMAVALDAWAWYYQSAEHEDEFFKYCDLTIEKGEKLLDKKKKDPWAKFFIGGADGYKGTCESRYERWITAFRYGWKGVMMFKDVEKENPDIVDLYYGLGIYDYWRSSLTKTLFWMPGVVDKRQDGINQLYTVKKNGLFARVSAADGLITILCNEGRYVEALTISNEMLEQYPGNLSFSRGKAASLKGLKQLGEAEQIYRNMLFRVETESKDNHYNAILFRFELAQIYREQDRLELCLNEYRAIGSYTLSVDVAKRLQKVLVQANAQKIRLANVLPKGPKSVAKQ